MKNRIIKPSNKTISSYEKLLDLRLKPFILVDAGAAGKVIKEWKQI